MSRPARNRWLAVALVVVAVLLGPRLPDSVLWALVGVMGVVMGLAVWLTMPFHRARSLLRAKQYDDAATELAAFELGLSEPWKRRLAGLAVGLPEILGVTIPATLFGVAAGTLSVVRRGAELADDPEYQRRLAAGELAPPAPARELPPEERRRALGACAVFLAAISVVVLLGLFPQLRPLYEVARDGVVTEDRIEMGRAIMVVMLAAGRWVAKRGWPADSSTTDRVGRLWLAPGGGSMRHDSGAGLWVVGRWRDSCFRLAVPDGHAA